MYSLCWAILAFFFLYTGRAAKGDEITQGRQGSREGGEKMPASKEAGSGGSWRRRRRPTRRNPIPTNLTSRPIHPMVNGNERTEEDGDVGWAGLIWAPSARRRISSSTGWVYSLLFFSTLNFVFLQELSLSLSLFGNHVMHPSNASAVQQRMLLSILFFLKKISVSIFLGAECMKHI